MKRSLFSLLYMIYFISNSLAQKSTCGTEEAVQQLNRQNQIERRNIDYKIGRKIDLINTTGIQSIITIPVVVHVIYNDPSENISDVQIQSQIDVLNEDF